MSKVSKIVIVTTGGNDCAGCTGDNGNGDYKDEQRTPIFIALKAFGCILVMLSAFEFGVAGAASNVVLENGSGFWGGDILAFIAGFLAIFSRNRGVVIAAIVVGSIAIIIAIVGALADSAAHDVALRVKACSSQSSYGSPIIDYGSQGHYEDSRYCLEKVGRSVVRDRCYCTSTGVFFSFYENCDEFTISASARSSGQNCEAIFTTYTSLLEGSTALNSLISIFSLVLTILGCVITCKKRDALLLDDANPAVGIAGNDA
jgi:hypothetical protein